MVRKILLIAVLSVLPCAVQAQQENPARQQQPNQQQQQQQRRRLEEQIFNQFLNRVSTNMGLAAPARPRLEQFLRRSGNERRMRTQQTQIARRQLMLAVRDSARSDAEIGRLIAQMESLKQQEDDQWKRDQATLSQMLTARQRGIFLLQYMQFNERIMQIMAERPATGR